MSIQLLFETITPEESITVSARLLHLSIRNINISMVSMLNPLIILVKDFYENKSHLMK